MGNRITIAIVATAVTGIDQASVTNETEPAHWAGFF